MVNDRRLSPREDFALLVELDGESSAVMRNLSASGLYLEVLGMYRPEGLVKFEIETDRLKFVAHAEVVRLDYRPSTTGVAFEFACAKLKAVG